MVVSVRGVALCALCACSPAEGPPAGETSGPATGSGASSSETGETVGSGSEGSTTTGGFGSSESSAGESSTGAPPGELCDADYAQVVYVNFDGVTIGRAKTDDAQANVGIFPGEYAAYANDDAAEVLDELRRHFAPFDVCLTEVRPAAGPYAMLVVSSTPMDALRGLGPSIDCSDVLERANLNPNDIAYVFADPRWATSYRAVAAVGSSVLGFGFGLGSVEEGFDEIMYTEFAPGDVAREFTDACLTAEPVLCPFYDHCPPGQQNSYRRLLDTFGPNPRRRRGSARSGGTGARTSMVRSP